MELLQKLIQGKDLTENEAREIINGIINAEYTPAQTAGFLVALKMKGESESEITAFAKIMRDKAIQIKPKTAFLVDTCGTGGDKSYTFNISTTAAFIAAGAGVCIAKHGNKAVSGRCGTADVLEQLGVKMLAPEKVEKCIENIGIGFMFAPFFHPAMKKIMPIRKELGIRTIFNILGPLINPANAQAQLLGVFDPLLTETFAKVLDSLGTERALIVHSEGMDEIGLGKTKICELKNKRIKTYFIKGEEFGFEKQEVPRVHSAEQSAEIIHNILKGEKGPERDIAVLNAGAAIYLGKKAETIKQGVKLAEESIDSGNALKKLLELKELKY